MAAIILSTLNATYQHCSFGLRYLFCNLQELKPRARMEEFTISQKPRDIAEHLLRWDPQIIGFGVYIWNAEQTLAVVLLLKQIAPEIKIVLGGPEVSFETPPQPIVQLADYVVCGEGEVLFRELCRSLLEGKNPPEKVIRGELPDLEKLTLPYEAYSDGDIKNRILYVEASRGCPFKCEFCLSSLDTAVRVFPMEKFLDQIDRLIHRGARQFKFVDRTFNLNVSFCEKILRFFLERMREGLFLHFELIPDRLPLGIQELITQFPSGSLQFEIGIQTWNAQVQRYISRRQDHQKVIENFKFLREATQVHIHADLIAGLPGEDLRSFGEGFDKLYDLRPQEIQVGLLKRLKGTPIIRHNETFQMSYEAAAPFQIVKNRDLPFSDVQRISKFSKFWDLYANSGNFPGIIRYLEKLSQSGPVPSVFWEFMRFTEYLDGRHPQRYGIALLNLVESAWCYLTEEREQSPEVIRPILISDYSGRVRRDIPHFLRPALRDCQNTSLPGAKKSHSLSARQWRHLS